MKEYIVLRVIDGVEKIKFESDNRSLCHKIEDIKNEINRTGFSRDDKGAYYVTCARRNLKLVCKGMGVEFKGN